METGCSVLSARARGTRGSLKTLLLQFLTAGVAVLFVLAVIEGCLRWHSRSVRAKSHLDAGLAIHDPVLGWRLTPGWSGEHVAADFKVSYTINEQGYRREPRKATPASSKFAAVLGDSFTFGLGVADGQSLVARLNELNDEHIVFVNFGVPGYSTDQEVLQLEKEILPSRPSLVILVTYVANDLFDNLLDFPLQMPQAKPRFGPGTNGTLLLTNSPVPALVKFGPHLRRDLASMILGENESRSLAFRLLDRSALGQMARDSLQTLSDRSPELEARFAPAVDLYERLIVRANRDCAAAGIPFAVVLLAGRSYFEQPTSLSGQFQDVLCRKSAELCQRRMVGYVPVAQTLRQRHPKPPVPWFYPHDGHLTQKGCGAVAEIITDHLRQGKLLPRAGTAPAGSL